MKSWRVLVDMDEVLADFTDSALTAHGWSRERFEIERKPGVWNIATTMGITDEEFWKPIYAQGWKFWQLIRPLPFCNEVMELVKEFSSNWFIVSSPANCRECIPEKRFWLWQRFGEVAVDRFIPTRHKHVMANDFTILIDDNEDNLSRFANASGHSVLFPTMGNSLHAISNNPVEHVRVMLERFAYNASTL